MKVYQITQTMQVLEVRNLLQVYSFVKIIKFERTQHEETGSIAENFEFLGLSYLIKFPIKQATMDKKMEMG